MEKFIESESSKSTPIARKVGDEGTEEEGGKGGTRRGITENSSSSLRTVGSKQLNDKIYSSVARLPLALPEGRRVIDERRP